MTDKEKELAEARKNYIGAGGNLWAAIWQWRDAQSEFLDCGGIFPHDLIDICDLCGMQNVVRNALANAGHDVYDMKYQETHEQEY